MGKTVTELAAQCFATFKEKGWLDGRSVPEDIALIHSEASEALEDHRDGCAPTEAWYEEKHVTKINPDSTSTLVIRHAEMFPKRQDGTHDLDNPRKPCGIPSEMADIVIRILNFCEMHNIDLERAIVEKMAYNATRPARHGGKRL